MSSFRDRSHPMVRLCEHALAVRHWTKRRRLSNVARSAMEAWKVPRGRNGWIRPVAVIGARVKRSLRKINLHNEAIL